MRSGKTVIYGALIGKLKPNKCIVAVPWADLKLQVQKKLEELEIHRVKVETIQKLLLEPDQQVDLLILDECQHVGAPYWSTIFEKIYSPIVIGGSGTPFRLDKEPLLSRNGGPFNCLVEGPSITDLTNQGYLANLIYKTPALIEHVEHLPIYFQGEVCAYIDSITMEAPDIQDQVVNKYSEGYSEQSAIVFCKSVNHAEETAKEFRTQGVEARAVHYYIGKRDRGVTLENFKNGKITVLTTCNLLSEGFDSPKTKLGILLRRTNSLSLFLQQASRVLTPDKDRPAIILDLVGNIYKHGEPTAVKIREHII